MKDLLFAARPLASDFFPTIIFAALLALHLDVRVAIAAALLIGIGQLAVQKALKRKIELLQWASLGLVVVFGALGMMTHDARFLMVKPSIIYVAIGLVMLRRGWMIRYLPPEAVEHAGPLMIGWGYAWACLMFLTAVANLVVAWRFPALWPPFIAVAPMASKIVLFAINFTTVRYFARRHAADLRARQGQAEAQAA